MDVVLYSTGCPRCTVLKKKLNEKNINYSECTDIDKMTFLGIQTVPVLSINNELMVFNSAVNWINNYNEV